MVTLLGERRCPFCGRAIEEGQLVYQIEVDGKDVGFTYLHKECMDKKKPERVTYGFAFMGVR